MKEQENKYGYVLAHVNESNVKREWFNGHGKLPDLDNWKWTSKNYKRVSLSDEELRQLFGKNKFCQNVGQQLMLWYENTALGYPDGRGTWRAGLAVALAEYSKQMFPSDLQEEYGELNLSKLWKYADCKVAPQEILNKVYIDRAMFTKGIYDETLWDLARDSFWEY